MKLKLPEEIGDEMISQMVQYFTVKEFANVLMVHPSTVRRAINKGIIRATKVGFGKKSIYRIHQSEIERIAFLELANSILERAIELNQTSKEY